MSSGAGSGGSACGRGRRRNSADADGRVRSDGATATAAAAAERRAPGGLRGAELDRRLPWLLMGCGVIAVLSLLLFTHGFLLTRYEISAHSRGAESPSPFVELQAYVQEHCELSASQTPALASSAGSSSMHRAASATPAAHSSPAGADSPAHCWIPPLYHRAVVLVVDALRYDFVHWREQSPPTEALAGGSGGLAAHLPPLQLYHNQMPLSRALLQRRNSSASLFRFVADAPTTTMQRLKGLTTGQLPTFIDIRDNFQSAAVSEDNLIVQAAHSGLLPSVMGDDTWVGLFPEEFTRAHPYPSFDVKDLDTVDNGCLQHLPAELAAFDRSSTPALSRLLIAHFLGVDHVGHRHGPRHPEIRRKLRQMDRTVDEVARSLAEWEERCRGALAPAEHRRTWQEGHRCRSLLLVLGDHGMTEDGNHGGASADEVTAALLVHSPSSAPDSSSSSSSRSARPAPYAPPAEHVLRHWARRLRLPEHSVAHVVHSVHPELSLNQIDLVPTLACLLALPIPYGNLGRLFSPPALFGGHLPLLPPPSAGAHDRASLATAAHRLSWNLWAVHLNAWQLHRYLGAYARGAGGGPQLSEVYRERALPALRRADQLMAAAAQLPLPQRAGLRPARAATALPPLPVGELTAAPLAVLLALAENEYALYLESTLEACRAQWSTFDLPAMCAGLLGLTACSLCFAGALMRARSSAGTLSLSPPPWMTAAILGCFAAHALGLLSNSYIEAEHHVVEHLLSGLALLHWVHDVSMGGQQADCGAQDAGLAAPGAGLGFIPTAPSLLLLLLQLADLCVLRPLLEATKYDRLPLLSLCWALLAVAGHAVLLWRAERSLSPLACGAFACVALHWWIEYAAAAASGWQAVWVARACFALCALQLLWQPRHPLAAAYAPLLLLGQARYAMALLLTAVRALLWLRCWGACGETGGRCRESGAGVWAGLVWCLLGLKGFFDGGHTFDFGSLQIRAAFTGLYSFQFAISGALLAANTFGALLLLLLLLATVARRRQRPAFYREMAHGVTIGYLVCAALSTALVFVERRHLMVWRVFCPKYVFDAALAVLHLMLTIPLVYWITGRGGKLTTESLARVLPAGGSKPATGTYN
jgi:GPI ethanolamine phosphate transferase 3 subunit O